MSGTAKGLVATLAVVIAALLVTGARAGPPDVTADFTFSPSTPAAGEVVTFTSTSTTVGATILREDWDFDGDGQFDAFGRTVTWTFAVPGTYTVQLRVQDSAGRMRRKSKTVTVVGPPAPPPPDTVAPETTITAAPSGTTTDNTPTFTFASSESPSTFSCSLDGGAFTVCASPTTTAALPDGDHTFAVSATDAAGNTDPTPDVRGFTVAAPTAPPPDTVPPETTITAGPAGTTSDSTPTFSFAANESPAAFECSVDGGAFGACASPYTTAARSGGDHVFAVRATDAAGNVDASPATRAFSVTTATAVPANPGSLVTSSSSSTTTPLTVIAPSPVVRIQGRYSARGIRLTRFTVTAPLGVKVLVRCRGRGCPFAQRGPLLLRTSNTRLGASGRYRSFPDFRDRLLRPGTRIEVLVSQPARIGKFTSFTVRRGRPPLRTDGCVRPGRTVAPCA